MRHYSGDERISLNVNGEQRSLVVRPADTLLRTLRSAGYTGTKIGCENGDCGACTVLVDGAPRKSCCTLTLDVVDRKITTIEGLAGNEVQRAFIENNGFQCGYCTPGFVVNTTALLESRPGADQDTVREWLESNICRCTGYEGIRNAICQAQGESRAVHENT
jgi:carbon-monoxide dehydrogenase small subunit